MKLHKDVYLMFAGNLIFLLAVCLNANHWLFAAAVALQFGMAIPVMVRLFRTVRAGADRE